MSLVMKICQYIHVLDFGKPIFEGTAEQVRTSELVRAAYLGDEMVEERVRAQERSTESKAAG
jgi:ABC-type lipopolysaccharide export system ATPase subunit